ncbi:hypothetical protein [Xenorhabdus taiwanensis]|uniref:Uncharacterized protein n=1 Tax=Xenorhabdus taiwanensis TaxID=3085177 RepID=A0ABN7C0W7_9GAMM|nr:hypothetical protein TCT1_10420 [Xenorhabdus sp. TCT-1]
MKLYLAIKQTGHDITTVPESAWLKKLEHMVVNGNDVALGSLIHLFKENALNIGNSTYNNQSTREAINALGLDFPDINAKTFSKLISYFMKKSSIPSYKPESKQPVKH